MTIQLKDYYMKKQAKIFLGGSYSSGPGERSKIADAGKIIENVIRRCGFEPSLNLLTEKKVHSHAAKAEEVKFSNGQYFLQVGEKVLSSILRSQLEKFRGMRSFGANDEFIICAMAANIALSELKSSVAAIFELSEKSGGSMMEIGLAAFYHQIPILALSSESWGKSFGTMLTGLPTNLLKTVKYNDETHLENIVEKFLIKDYPEKKLFNATYKLSAKLKRELEKEAFEKKVSVSELVRQSVERYLSDKI